MKTLIMRKYVSVVFAIVIVVVLGYVARVSLYRDTGVGEGYGGDLPIDEVYADSSEGSKTYAREIPVLTYHHILTEEENPYPDNGMIISVELFEKHMKYLHNEGFHTITLKELELFLKNEIRLPEKSVLITFDDGYKSNIVHAYPILKKYNQKAAIFIISSYITDETVAFNPEILQYASWEELEKSNDVFEYGCHTHDFHHLEDDEGYLLTKSREAVREDLRVNLEMMQSPYFAYPYGHYNQEVIDVLKELGYHMAFTVEEGNVQHGDNRFKLKRRNVYSFTSLKDFKRLLKPVR
ncbi:putative xylanase/chitin deacetylase [Clostridium aceticum]|uniref:Putative xylanase/chitin deacetylase n=1 Tax=Clostridium aceticum TaxID=84022 RepID=A0A0G3WA70_9CLOT|nr:polysaccharide deacetylase family protein [Clostridium aceticum]AKL94807.1 putative xylanase/chitin deacetylase [Clostridium aceticum]